MSRVKLATPELTGAFTLGRKAARQGLRLQSNPYRPCSDGELWRAWNRGYADHGKSPAALKYQRKVQAVVAAHGEACWLCLKPIERDLTLDHVTPKSKGGTAAVSNLRPAHFECNQKRGNGPPPELLLTADMMLQRSLEVAA